MSLKRRKISYWSIDFIEQENHKFDPSLLCRFMDYITNLDEATRLEKYSSINKAISIESVKHVTIRGNHLLKIIFKSCKFNHSPAYMSSKDGTERPSLKKLDEGEKELTHICMRLDANEAYTAFEERRNGVTMNTMIQYLNRFFIDFTSSESDKAKLLLSASIVPSDEFVKSLDNTQRISSVELFVENKVLGSEFLNLMDWDVNTQDDIVITVKSKPRLSIQKRLIKEVYLKIATEGKSVSRIRVRGKDINKMSVVIDSLDGKKVDEVTVKLTENGIVDTNSIFSKFEEILGVVK